MYEAELGDDCYGEDPTVNRLEALRRAAGKEAGLFTASGTMSNLLATLTHTRAGDEVIVGSESHILWYEVGGAGASGAPSCGPYPTKWTAGWTFVASRQPSDRRTSTTRRPRCSASRTRTTAAAARC